MDSYSHDDAGLTRVHILRHGQALHNVDREYKYRDPPLTETGAQQARAASLPAIPDLILISPMTRTIQTTNLAFGDMLLRKDVSIETWSDLREAHDAICNQGVTREEMEAKFPDIDFSQCSKDWDYPPHSFEDAVQRAEKVRLQVKRLAETGKYRNIYLVTHRGFIAFLVQGPRFNVCECRSYRLAADEEQEEVSRYGQNIDAGLVQDYGPTMFLPIHSG